MELLRQNDQVVINVQPKPEVDEKISTFHVRRRRDPRGAIGGQGHLIETRIGCSQP